jgi:hypothetical protein
MKYIITESQYKIILEQSDYMMDRRSNALLKGAGVRSDKDYKQVNKVIDKAQGPPLDKHELLGILGIATAFIPVVGPFITAGIGLLDAAIYYKEGDKTSAGLVGVLSMLPFAGKVISKIPGVKQLGTKGMAILAQKLGSGGKNLTPLESQVAKAINANGKLITEELKQVSTKLTPLTNTIKQFKPQYIERFGQGSYDDLLNKLLSNQITKEGFTEAIQKTTQKTASKLTVKGGIKILQNELNAIKKLGNDVLYGEDGLKEMAVQTKQGLKNIKVFIADDESMKRFFPNMKDAEAFKRGDDMIVLVKNKLKNFDSTEIENLLTHELSHIKDPAEISSKLKNSYIKKGEEATFKNYFGHQFEKTAELTASLNNMNRTFTSWKKLLPKEQLIGYFDEIINFGRGKIKTLSKDATAIIGSDGVAGLRELAQDPEAYRKFISKIVQQADYLKSQVNVAM